jgi:hypothetical protein
MIINSYLVQNGGNEKLVNDNNLLEKLNNNNILCLSLCYSYSPPKLRKWEKPKHDVAISSVYDVGQVVSGDFSVWCDEKQEYVNVNENTVIRNGDKYIYFVPCFSDNMKGWKEVTGEFELNFYLYNTKIKVKC